MFMLVYCYKNYFYAGVIMYNDLESIHSLNKISVGEAILLRRSTRDFKTDEIDNEIIVDLLEAAVHAPTAMHQEPWSFVVIQNKSILQRLSDSAKKIVRKEGVGSHIEQIFDLLDKPDFNIFYNSGTLIVIYSKFNGSFVSADCWLAAENLILKACSKSIGSCVIGFAVSALNQKEWKDELGVSQEMTAIAPIIIGYPARIASKVSRNKPEIMTWIK